MVTQQVRVMPCDGLKRVGGEEVDSRALHGRFSAIEKENPGMNESRSKQETENSAPHPKR